MKASAKRSFIGAGVVAVVLVCAVFGGMLAIYASGSGARSYTERDIVGTTDGPAYTEPSSIATSVYSGSRAQAPGEAYIDTSHRAEGYVGASAVSESRLKLQVSCDQMSYNYDMPPDGTPVIAPVNMADGSYNIRVLEGVGASQYVEIASVTQDIVLENEFQPFLRPNIFCNYNEQSACVQKARELAADADNEGDAVRAIYRWMIDTIEYDYEKASDISGTSGYVPEPDATLMSQSGICFDYASLAAAMFRSLGMPCQIVTGNVAPEDVYHAWNMIYIDGAWHSVLITVDPDDWTRIDLTFAASDGGRVDTTAELVYTERYRY